MLLGFFVTCNIAILQVTKKYQISALSFVWHCPFQKKFYTSSKGVIFSALKDSLGELLLEAF